MSDKSSSVKSEKSQKDDIVKVESSTNSKVAKENEMIVAIAKKRLESMTDEEIIEENLKVILDQKSREERKANGRLVAVLVALLVIFLAAYQAWIRKTAGILAGILVPAVIMLFYGGWVVILAKRDKRKRAMFEKHIEEVALKNKAELEQKAKAKQAKLEAKKMEKAKMHYEYEKITEKRNQNGRARPGGAVQIVTVEIEEHRKQQRKRLQNKMEAEVDKKKENPKDVRIKRPSFREKFFRPSTITTKAPNDNAGNKQIIIPIEEKRKKFQRMDTLPMPQIVRMSSAP